jgi:hypothetical protein
MLLALGVQVPQIVLGGFVSFAGRDLYPFYALCGRLLDVTPLLDQQIRRLHRLVSRRHDVRDPMTLAAVDRLVHHAVILEMNVESYRQRDATNRQKQRTAALPRLECSRALTCCLT